MLKSKIYPNSKHRLGRSPRVKIEDEKLKIAGVLELADKQASDTCVFNMRVQVPSPAPKKDSGLYTILSLFQLNPSLLGFHPAEQDFIIAFL